MRVVLDPNQPDFFVSATKQLEEYEEVEIGSFICKDWLVYYNLYNPENFEDPDNPPEWYTSADIYDYYETPYTNPDKVLLFCNEKTVDLSALRNLIEHGEQREQEILSRLVKYTFGNDSAYAAGVHYDYAKKTIEQLHQKTYTKEAFLKRNLCLDTIELVADQSVLLLHFDCSWDEEHGLLIRLEDGEIVEIE